MLKRGDDQADIAPYGGMMFHRDLLMRVGLPDEKYFLYADDYDFTNRVAKIYFVADALVHDVDNRVGQQSRLFTARLNTADFSKLYYSVRNLAYFESYFWNQNQLVYSVNRLLFMAVLTGLALSKNRFLRYKIILQAIRDGKNASLGANPAYQI
jgi:GT2 family glycosyltransferase